MLSLLLDPFHFKKVLVVGDSHARVFNNPNFKIYFPLIKFDVCSIGGATISGLENPNSKTNANKKFRNKINQVKKSTIIFLLGEVDTGFVIFYRAEKYQESIENMLEQTLLKYQELLKYSLSVGNDLILISTPLPVIADGNNWGEVAKLRKSVKTPLKERMNLTKDFNKKMSVFCQINSIKYVDLDNSLSTENGEIKSIFLNKNILDHHYDDQEYSKLICRKLKNII